MNDCALAILFSAAWAASFRILYAVLPTCVTCTYACFANALLSAIIAYFSYRFFKRKYFDERVMPRGKAVLITGCDHGFGHELAKRLDSRGFTVFASCLLPDGDGAKSLKEVCSDRLHVLGLNVTDDKSIESAVTYVKSNLGTSELWAVVNNAGIWKGCDVALTPVTEFEDCFDVNTLGPVRVSKAFLPLLIASKGRFVNVTSLASRIAIPHAAAYNMSKYAARAFCEVLRQELRPWGVRLIEIEPEGFTTHLVDKSSAHATLESHMKSIDPELAPYFDQSNFNLLKRQCDRFLGFFSSRLYKVIDDLEEAVSNLEPCQVYKPRQNVLFSLILLLLEVLPTPLFDLAVRAFKYLAR